MNLNRVMNDETRLITNVMIFFTLLSSNSCLKLMFKQYD